MSLKSYRAIFLACSSVLILIAAFPTLALVVPFPSRRHPFSELYVLGPNRMAEDYPFNIVVNNAYHIFVGFNNHMGSSSYYLVYVKFRNQTQSLPNATTSEPSQVQPLYEFRTFVVDGGTWEAPLTFSVLEASSADDFMFVRRLSINDVAFPVNLSARWDSKYNGFYYQLFFELWLYNSEERSFQFHNRFVGIWFNVTS